MLKKIILPLLLFCFTAISYAQYKQLSKKKPVPIIDPINPGETTEFPNECFCHFNSDFDNFVDAVNAIAAQGEAIRQQFLEHHENLLKEELEDRMGQDFNSFHDAQKEFFKRSHGYGWETSYYNDFMQDTNNSISIIDERRMEEFYEYKIFDLRLDDIERFFNGQSAIYDFGDLKRDNLRIEDMGYGDVSAYRDVNYGHYTGRNNQLGNLNVRKESLFQIRENNQFAAYIADQFINHYNTFDNLYERIGLMIQYMVYDWTGSSLSIPPPWYGFYEPGLYDYSPAMEDLIANSGVPYNAPSEPDFNFEDLKVEYAIGQMPQSVENYLDGQTTMRDELGDYLKANDFDEAALDLSEDFLNHITNNQYYIFDSSLLDGTSIGLQTEDRPNKVMTVNLSSTAESQGMFAINQLLEAYSDSNPNLWFEGSFIRQVFSANGYHVSNDDLDNRDLGTLFDFHFTGNGWLNIYFDREIWQNIISPYTPGHVYGWSLFTDQWKLNALWALANGGSVDFRNGHIYNEATTNLINELEDYLGRFNPDERNWVAGDNPAAQGLLDWLGVECSDGNCSQETLEFTEYGLNVLLANSEANPFLGADCRSFEYALPPGALQRGCAVENFNHTFYTTGVNPDGTFYYGEIDSEVPIAYFTMPNSFTNGQAANATAVAVTLAVHATDLYYLENPNVIATSVTDFFRQALISELAIIGGTVNTNTAPFPISSPAPYLTSFFGARTDCN